MESKPATLADPVAERVAARVRAALADAAEGIDLDAAVDAAREAMIDEETVSLFGLETDHPEHGSVRWIVGQSNGDSESYVVLALTPVGEGGEHGLHAAASADLSEALLRLAPEFGQIPVKDTLPA